MRVASWNVNSLKVRLPHVLTWLEMEQPDALGLQELKMDTSAFPHEAFENAGYQAWVHGQKTYNGVAWLIKKSAIPPESVDDATVIRGLPTYPEDQQARGLALTFCDTRFIVFYVPNGQAVGSDKYEYKLKWLAAAQQFLADELQRYPKMVVVGDFNIAPTDADVHDPVAWEGMVLCSPPERAAWQGWLDIGLHDAFRLFEQPDKSFSWWDYRQGGFRRNQGLRIDHILISEALKPHAVKCWIDKEPRIWERPSDHTPVILDFNCER